MAVEWGWRVGIYSCCVADIAIVVIRRLCVLTMGAPSNRKPTTFSSHSVNQCYRIHELEESQCNERLIKV